MSDALLFSGGIVIVVIGVRLLNDKAGMFGVVVLLAGLIALARACGLEWINR